MRRGPPHASPPGEALWEGSHTHDLAARHTHGLAHLAVLGVQIRRYHRGR